MDEVFGHRVDQHLQSHQALRELESLPSNWVDNKVIAVARLMPSTSDSRQPYRLSNLDFVTESFTLKAGQPRLPSFIIS